MGRVLEEFPGRPLLQVADTKVTNLTHLCACETGRVLEEFPGRLRLQVADTRVSDPTHLYDMNVVVCWKRFQDDHDDKPQLLGFPTRLTCYEYE